MITCNLCRGADKECPLCDGIGSYPETPEWLRPHVETALNILVSAVDTQIIDEIYREGVTVGR